DDQPLDHDVRVVAEQIAVLERPRLPFVRVAHDVFRARKLARHEAPFEAGRETRAPAAAQGGFLDFPDAPIGRGLLGGYLPRRRAAAVRLVVLEPPVEAREPAHDYRLGPEQAG